MKTLRAVPILVVAALAACSNETQKKLDQMAIANSMRADSLASVRRELLEAVATSAEFLSDIDNELAEARFLVTKPTVMGAAEIPDPNLERNQAVMKVGQVVARLDSVEKRLGNARTTVALLSRKDSALLVKVAEFEKNVADLQASAETQRIELQTMIDGQVTQIAGLTTHVSALKDTVGHLTSEKNTAYVIIGTRDELIKKGILVAEGSKRFLVAGPRSVKPARTLDPSAFTKIDRTVDRTIVLPAGKYEIISRQNPTAATSVLKNGKVVSGVVTIEQPEQFWEASPFLIIVRT